MRIVAGALLVMLSVTATAGEPKACELQPADIEALLDLPFEKFDQQQNSGWPKSDKR